MYSIILTLLSCLIIILLLLNNKFETFTQSIDEVLENNNPLDGSGGVQAYSIEAPYTEPYKINYQSSTDIEYQVPQICSSGDHNCTRIVAKTFTMKFKEVGDMLEKINNINN
jgi:hypothetical protein